MDADRKQWPLEGADVQLVYTVKDRASRWIDRQITLRGPIGDDQRARLAMRSRSSLWPWMTCTNPA